MYWLQDGQHVAYPAAWGNTIQRRKGRTDSDPHCEKKHRTMPDKHTFNDELFVLIHFYKTLLTCIVGTDG